MDDSENEGQAPPATILFVEDEVLIRMDMAEFLRTCGYRVHEAGNAVEALDVLQSKFAMDVVVTDIDIPGDMDGRALAKWVRDNRPGVGVILASGVAQATDAAEHSAFIGKPYTGRALLELVRQALAKSASHETPNGAAGAA
jgi:DNA-binding NtrC family response regulator